MVGKISPATISKRTDLTRGALSRKSILAEPVAYQPLQQRLPHTTYMLWISAGLAFMAGLH